jgi:arginine deiminase
MIEQMIQIFSSPFSDGAASYKMVMSLSSNLGWDQYFNKKPSTSLLYQRNDFSWLYIIIITNFMVDSVRRSQAVFTKSAIEFSLSPTSLTNTAAQILV